jgi:surface polysaccharide O-acyltransferase-like enzyme
VNCVIGILNIIFDVSSQLELEFFTGYVGYFVLGYYLYNYTFTKKELNTAYLLGLAGFAISCLFPYLCILLHFEDRGSLIESDFTPDIVLVEIALFQWFKNRSYNEEGNSAGKKMITEISNESFGIYFVHVLLMQIIFSEDRGYFNVIEGWHPGWTIPLKAFVILVLSYGVIKIMKLVPGLRKVAG